MKYGKSAYLPIFVIVGTLLAVNVVSAETKCTVEPFTTKILQGESANLSVLLSLDSPSTPFELSLGSMPNNTEGGFNANGFEQGSLVKKVPLSLSAKTNAQTGSFMITVISKSALTATTYQTSCQFNLEIGKRAVPAGAVTPESPQQGQLSRSVGAGVLPAKIASSSTIILRENTTSAIIAPANKKITANMQKYSRGIQVKLLQEILQKLGFFPAGETPTGYFGPITEAAVKAFQASKGLEQVGFVGPKTKKILESYTGSMAQ